MSPTDNTLQVMQNGSTTYEMTQYYATCVGDAPFAASLEAAQTASAELTQSIDLLVALCPNNEYVANMAAEVPAINYNLADITNNTACPPYQSQIDSVLQNGVCHSGFNGFFIIWIFQFETAFALFILTIAASICYQYFDWVVQVTEQPSLTTPINPAAGEVSAKKTIYTYNYTDNFRYADPIQANSSYRAHPAVTNSQANDTNAGSTTLVYGSPPDGAEMTRQPDGGTSC
jgi:hypothetical protein